MTPLFAFFNLGPQEMLILLIIGILLFGRKLPEIARWLGRRTGKKIPRRHQGD